MNKLTNALIQTMLADLKATGGPLDACKVQAYGAVITPTQNTLLADLAPIAVPGMAAQTVTFHDPSYKADGTWEMLGLLHVFSITDIAQPCTITGFCIWKTISAVDTLLWAENIAVPITLDNLSKIAGYIPNLSNQVAVTNWGEGINVL
jgi:hypothetical protein